MDDLDRQNIFDHTETTNQIMVVNISQNLSHMYYNHYSIIKFVDLESIHYGINLYVVSSFMIFSKFDYVLIVSINKINFLKKNYNKILLVKKHLIEQKLRVQMLFYFLDFKYLN